MTPLSIIPRYRILWLFNLCHLSSLQLGFSVFLLAVYIFLRVDAILVFSSLSRTDTHIFTYTSYFGITCI